MVDKKLSEFNSVSTSDVTDLVVLYDNNGNIRNGKLAISQLSEAYASLEGNNRLLGDNVFSGNNTFSNPITGSITNAESDNDGNNIVDTYLRKDELPFDILDYKWSDRILNDIRWLNADTFSWQSGLIYKSAYDHLKEDYENADIVQTWQPVKLNENLYNTSHKWVGLCYNGTQIFAISDEGYISTSEDGKTWTNPELISGFSTRLVRDIAYGNGIFVILTAYGISTSTDGYNWTSLITIPNSTNLEHLLFANNEFILYDEVYNDIGKIFKSSNGINWTGYTVSGVEAGEDIGSLAYGNDMYIMTRFAGLYVYVSSDAINWTKHEIDGVEGLIYNIVFDGNDFIAFTNRNKFYASSDAINWTLIPNTPEYTTIGNHWSGTTNDSTIYLINDYGYSALRKDLSYETIGSYSIEYILAKDGHKIIMPDQELIAENIFRESGIAWYYVLDEENKRFKLPRENQHGQVMQSYTSDDKWCRIYSDGWCEQGGYYLPSAANTTVYLMKEYKDTSYTITTGCSYTSDGNIYTPCVAVTKNTDSFSMHVPNVNYHPFWRTCGYIDNYPTITSQKYLYFYVGQFSQTAIEQTAGLNAELFNGKADIDLDNVPSNIGDTAKSYFSGLGLPSHTYDDLTLGANGTTYEAPANGWFCINKSSSAAGQTVTFYNVNSEFRAYTVAHATSIGTSLFIPVLKGDSVRVNYTLGGDTGYFRFYYAEGETNV